MWGAASKLSSKFASGAYPTPVAGGDKDERMERLRRTRRNQTYGQERGNGKEMKPRWGRESVWVAHAPLVMARHEVLPTQQSIRIDFPAANAARPLPEPKWPHDASGGAGTLWLCGQPRSRAGENSAEDGSPDKIA